MIYVERNMIPLPEVFYSKDGEYADFDKEWLVPPATQRLFEGGKVEYSSILDGACFEGPQYFRTDKEQLQVHKTLDY
ncbi:hypothetical protein [Chryseobacterium limigenitum]|uniref:Uncharacterized protein n=1 Tax=Chryseobacterium limigenitum TaxID=1612149 RepID=A0A1K2IS02_9FLAO|nr:hypothetical protein [Chryseobacterium limigenitum]SFZ95151.1 hypothetical protein SAMN05216324_108171 [Chryseobacterium limigenitum]